MSLVIHAPNVHQGGGRTLLVPLLHALRPGSVAILDRRLVLPAALPQGVREIRIDPSVPARLRSEWTLRSIAGPSDTVLCFGNLPPLFPVPARVVVFVQNRYLTGSSCLDGFSLPVRLRLRAERLWLRLCARNADRIVVQSRSMKRDIAKSVGRVADILSLCATTSAYSRRVPDMPGPGPVLYDFLYVSTAEPHKNHARLLEAWRLLQREGIHPTLCLTVPARIYPELARQIESAHTSGLALYNAGHVEHEKIQELYRSARALIFPSMFESFGLPLIEARCAGLPVLAAETDYVRDVLDPEETFDPASSLSIARAVKRFLGYEEPPLVLVPPAEFLRRIADV